MKATGNNGCNSFFANFDTVEQRLSFGPVGSTRMACQNWMENEMAFLAMLQTTQRYTINGYTLLIMDENEVNCACHQAIRQPGPEEGVVC